MSNVETWILIEYKDSNRNNRSLFYDEDQARIAFTESVFNAGEGSSTKYGVEFWKDRALNQYYDNPSQMWDKDSLINTTKDRLETAETVAEIKPYVLMCLDLIK